MFIRCQVVIASLPAKATEVKTGGVCGNGSKGAPLLKPQLVGWFRVAMVDPTANPREGSEAEKATAFQTCALGVAIGVQAPVAWLQVHIPPAMPTA